MCTVSMVMQGWTDQFPGRWPNLPKSHIGPSSSNPELQSQIDALRKELEELKTLIKAAQKFDEATGQPECHDGEKAAFIKRLAEMLNVDMRDVFKE